MKSVIMGAALIVASFGMAHAASEEDYQLKTATNLANLCASTADSAAIHMCQGYLVGLHHMHQAVAEAAGRGIYCIPTDGSVTRDNAAAAYVGWVSANPGAASIEPRESVLEFARQTYPCQ